MSLLGEHHAKYLEKRGFEFRYTCGHPVRLALRQANGNYEVLTPFFGLQISSDRMTPGWLAGYLEVVAAADGMNGGGVPEGQRIPVYAGQGLEKVADDVQKTLDERWPANR